MSKKVKAIMAGQFKCPGRDCSCVLRYRSSGDAMTCDNPACEYLGKWLKPPAMMLEIIDPNKD